jgi:hypothetical protein
MTEGTVSEPTSRSTTSSRAFWVCYGDPSSKAEAMALKRAAAKFGLGLYLYQK